LARLSQDAPWRRARGKFDKTRAHVRAVRVLSRARAAIHPPSSMLVAFPVTHRARREIRNGRPPDCIARRAPPEVGSSPVEA
jgi:hypothetical protein